VVQNRDVKGCMYVFISSIECGECGSTECLEATSVTREVGAHAVSHFIAVLVYAHM
jgi:hypothetical protein